MGKIAQCGHVFFGIRFTLSLETQKWWKVKNRGPPRVSPTELDGSGHASGHPLHGPATSRTLPTTYITYRRKQQPKDAPVAPERGRQRTPPARPRSSRRWPLSTRRGSACAARRVRIDLAQDDGRTLRTSRTRAAQRSTEGAVSTVRSVEHGSAHAQGRDGAAAGRGIRRERGWLEGARRGHSPTARREAQPCTTFGAK